MEYKRTPSRVIFLVFAYAFLVLVGVLCLAPLWHVLMGSISDPTELNANRGLILWIKGKADFAAYGAVAGYKRLWMGYRNTLLYIAAQCIITGVLTIMAGYIFSRKRFYYRNAFIMIITFSMLINGGMIPTYMVMRSIHLLDTPFALLLPGALSVFNIMLMRTSMEGISDSLEDAARIDGASEFVIMFKIILPLCKATFAVVMLFTVVSKWNEYMPALLYLPTKSELYPLQMVLRDILISGSSNISTASDAAGSVSLYQKSIEYATIIVSTLPILCVYPFVQKYFVTGVTVGAVKS